MDDMSIKDIAGGNSLISDLLPIPRLILHNTLQIICIVQLMNSVIIMTDYYIGTVKITVYIRLL